MKVVSYLGIYKEQQCGGKEPLSTQQHDAKMENVDRSEGEKKCILLEKNYSIM